MTLEHWVETNLSLPKGKDMELDSSWTLLLLLCVETPFNKGVVPLSPSIHYFPISCFVFQGPYNSRKSFACLDNASSSCFVFYAISIHWELVLHFDDQDRELVKPIVCQCPYFASKTKRIGECTSKLIILHSVM